MSSTIESVIKDKQSEELQRLNDEDCGENVGDVVRKGTPDEEGSEQSVHIQDIVTRNLKRKAEEDCENSSTMKKTCNGHANSEEPSTSNYITIQIDADINDEMDEPTYTISSFMVDGCTHVLDQEKELFFTHVGFISTRKLKIYSNMLDLINDNETDAESADETDDETNAESDYETDAESADETDAETDAESTDETDDETNDDIDDETNDDIDDETDDTSTSMHVENAQSKQFTECKRPMTEPASSEFRININGHIHLLVNGFSFYKKSYFLERNVWYCSAYSSVHQCPARCVTLRGKLIDAYGEHNHSADH